MFFNRLCITLFLLLLIHHFSSAQHASTVPQKFIGTEIKISSSYSEGLLRTNFLNISLPIIISLKRHLLGAGPVFSQLTLLRDDDLDVDFHLSRPISKLGFQVKYGFYPGKLENRIKFFPEIELIKSFIYPNEPGTPISMDYDYSYSEYAFRISLTQVTIGYNVTAELTRHLYIFHSAGFGGASLLIEWAELSVPVEIVLEEYYPLLPVFAEIGFGLRIIKI